MAGYQDEAEMSPDSILAQQYRNEDEIIGYCEPWIASPGEQVAVKVSSTLPQYTWSLIRVVQGLQHPKAPPVKEEVVHVDGSEGTIVKGAFRLAHLGSYARVDSWKSSRNNDLKALKFECFVQPWLLQAGHHQILFSTLDVVRRMGIALLLNEKGALCAYVGDSHSISCYSSGIALRAQRWAKVCVRLDQSKLEIAVEHCAKIAEPAPNPSLFTAALSRPLSLRGDSPLYLAAAFYDRELQTTDVPAGCFNGRLDSPCIQISSDEQVYTTWAQYDFSRSISTDRIEDVSGHDRHGDLVNAPTRAVKDHEWDGSEADWTKAKRGYGAIHFHEDDLDDAEWPTDFTFTIPENAVSGAYAVVVKGARSSNEHISDSIVFFVRPALSKSWTACRTAIVLSTFTYLAYANEHMYDQTRESRMVLAGDVRVRKDINWRRMARRTDLGISVYDVHRDGSGGVYTSAKRPVLNIRPNYVNWAFHRPREFSADQLMIGLLEQKLGKGGYDVLTDHDLHSFGVKALVGYDVVMTGCHPEYPSAEVLDAWAAYAKSGGNIMYLGGNGFYWCSVVDSSRPHRVEVRKGDQGCRSIELPAGERINSLNGAQGGLWRAKGRPAQELFGVGCCACGNGPGVAFRWAAGIDKREDLSWMFRGLTRTKTGALPLLGVEGFGGGASGDEIDRVDYDLGTPKNTILLATSVGHDDSYGLFNEEILFPMVNTTGSSNPKIRSDLVIYDTAASGSIFSVGSINWYCSLGWNGYDNDVARLTWNVLNHFLERSRWRRRGPIVRASI